MKFQRAVILASLVSLTPCWAGPESKAPMQPTSGERTTVQPAQVAAKKVGQPRQPLPKRASIQKPAGESRLIVKFSDDVKARVNASQRVTSKANRNLAAVDAVAQQFNLTFRPVFRKSEDKLAAIEARAVAHSGKAQPDLAGMMEVQGNDAVLQAAAQALLPLAEVEYVYFDVPFQPAGVDPVCGDPGDCFTAHPTPVCEIADCCDVVGQLYPFCVDPAGQWDEICVALANLFCAIADGADRCESFLNGSCFEVHGTGGCVDSVCCNDICAIDTFCCEVFWDAGCVELAEDICVFDQPGGATPNFAALEGYLTWLSYADQPLGAPFGLSAPAPDAPDYAGEGLYLFSTTLLEDDPDITPLTLRYEGLYGLGRELVEQYNVGERNGARGLDIKVGVIEWSWFEHHEDLDVVTVLPTPGDKMITIFDVGFPDHATACLGIINAKENGKGVTGIAPDAKAYFFPLTSALDGPRTEDAFADCLELFGAGDVVSCSFGPPPININCVEGTFTLMGVGADLGITFCVAAGNSCFNLDGAEVFGSNSCIVVGAGTPGREYRRLTFSNYFRSAGAGENNSVNLQSWGESVTSTGGSANLWLPPLNNDPNEEETWIGDWNFSYCSDFSGTSSAAPQVAGVVACLQGLAKQFYGIPLHPSQIRAAIASSGLPQGGFQNPDDNPGFDEQFPCGADFDPDAEANKIGPYPEARGAGATILNQSFAGFDQSPNVDDILIIRGTHVFGTVFSIKASDDNYFVVDSLYTHRHHHSPFSGPAGEVEYLGSGQTVDIMVTGHADAPGNVMLVHTEAQAPGVFVIMITEAFDWVTGEWSFLGLQQMPAAAGGTDLFSDVIGTNASRFINPGNNDVLIRLYVLAIGGSSPGFGGVTGLPYTMLFDHVTLSIQQGFGQNNPGDPPGGFGG